jgi:hypothetical protein
VFQLVFADNVCAALAVKITVLPDTDAAQGEPLAELKALATGATFFLQKPIDKRKLAVLFRAVRGTMLENRRRYARVPLQTEVTCAVAAKVGTGRTWNLSQGGIQVEAGHLRTADKVRISFRLPSSAVIIYGHGTVVWGNEARQGIQFTKLTSEAHEAIRQFISPSRQFLVAS